jgi:hypothetical protein
MSAVVSPNAGTRIEPLDNYTFVRGTTATFKMTFTNEGMPTTIDANTSPVARIYQPNFINQNTTPLPLIVATLVGQLVPGQNFEYQFVWEIPNTTFASDQYIVSYEGIIGGNLRTFGDEFFTITPMAGSLGLRIPLYATVDDVRALKFNIDSFLPEAADTVVKRNMLIEKHLRVGTQRLREELALFKQRSNSENYRLFCTYYAIWSIMLASRGEDGSSISSQNLAEWKAEWMRILDQEKRESLGQGISFGRG